MIKLCSLILLLACGASAFGAPTPASDAFVVGGSSAHWGSRQPGYGVDFVRGSFAGFKAARIRERSEVFIVVALGSAKTWNEARSACRLLAPSGAWDLPGFSELSAAYISGVASPYAKLAGRSFYAAWLMSDPHDWTGDYSHFDGTDQVAVGASDVNSYWSLPSFWPLHDFIAELEQDAGSEDGSERDGYRQRADKLSAGVEVRCVSYRVK